MLEKSSAFSLALQKGAVLFLGITAAYNAFIALIPSGSWFGDHYQTLMYLWDCLLYYDTI